MYKSAEAAEAIYIAEYHYYYYTHFIQLLLLNIFMTLIDDFLFKQIKLISLLSRLSLLNSTFCSMSHGYYLSCSITIEVFVINVLCVEKLFFSVFHFGLVIVLFLFIIIYLNY